MIYTKRRLHNSTAYGQASWGVDYLKLDACNINDTVH